MQLLSTGVMIHCPGGVPVSTCATQRWRIGPLQRSRGAQDLLGNGRIIQDSRFLVMVLKLLPVGSKVCKF